jgi:hypothetical protein
MDTDKNADTRLCFCQDAKSNTIADNVGDCNEDFLTEAVLNLCLAGWHA